MLLPLTRAATLAGVVREAETGAPLGGVSVQAWNTALEGVEVRAAPDGTFRFEELPAGVWRVRAVPDFDRNRLVRWAPSAADFCAAATHPLGDDTVRAGLVIDSPAGATASGRVRDSAGSPVTGATVWMVAADDGSPLVDRPALTDPAGRFVVRGLDAPPGGAGAWQLLFIADGHPDQWAGPTYRQDDSARIDVPAEAAVDLGDHTLTDGILVEGTVRGPGGPVGGATVHVYSGGQVRTVTSGPDGAYAALGLPPGDVLPWTSPDGLALTYLPNHDRPTETLPAPEEGDALAGADLFPPEQAVFQAQLSDAATGAPLPRIQGLLYNSTQTVGRGNLTDDDGLLRIDGLHGGEYTLFVYGARAGFADDWVRGPDGEPAVLTLEAATEAAPLALPLAPAARLTGRVTDTAGQPLGGATVLARRSDGVPARATTDGAGAYTLTGLGPGEWAVEARVDPLCPGDATYVSVYAGPTVNPDWQSTLAVAEGSVTAGLDFALPVDRDADGMGDAWERTHGLDPTADDAAEDPDADSYPNLTEYHLGTDPTEPPAEARACGCGSAAWAPLLLPLGLWGRLRRRPRAP